MDKARIIAEIKRTAEENGGVPLGYRSFEDVTGIRSAQWHGKFWRSWSHAIEEAGLAPNLPPKAHEKVALVKAMVQLTRKVGHFPTNAEFFLEKRTDPTFPTFSVIKRKFGSRSVQVELVRTYATEHVEYRDVLDLLPEAAENGIEGAEPEGGDGSVYMLKLGKHFKIGKTFSVPRRHREIALELPEKPDVVHVITTDDPTGIEAYWHARFASKRTNGEWFSLTRDDIRAFKRRKFM